jgi:8-oxo-dGTP pyrophosphatase MutT (NUDIX family)
MSKKNPWSTSERNRVFDCPYFSVRVDTVSLSGRTERSYNSIRMKKSGVTVVPIDQDGCTVLVGQYRYVLDRFTWEVTRGGGRLDAPSVESAQAELLQETGYRARHWLQIFDASASPGISDELAPGYVAWGLERGAPQPDEEELLVSRRVPFAEAVELALSGEIADLASIALLLAIDARGRRGTLPADLLELVRGTGSRRGPC